MRSAADVGVALAVVRMELAKLRQLPWSEYVECQSLQLTAVQFEIEDRLRMLIAEQCERGEA